MKLSFHFCLFFKKEFGHVISKFKFISIKYSILLWMSNVLKIFREHDFRMPFFLQWPHHSFISLLHFSKNQFLALSFSEYFFPVFKKIIIVVVSCLVMFCCHIYSFFSPPSIMDLNSFQNLRRMFRLRVFLLFSRLNLW